MAAQISKFIIALILVGVFASGLTIFMSGMSQNYSATYDNASIQTFNKLTEINNLTEELETKMDENSGLKSNSNDILGGFFSDGYKAMLITKKSFSTFKTMAQATAENTNLGAEGFGAVLYTAIISIVIVIIVIGIFISALVKREM
jgi:hypothetical protein